MGMIVPGLSVDFVLILMFVGPWAEHGTAWYSCNRYDDKSGVDARDAQSKSRASLERYLHVRTNNSIFAVSNVELTFCFSITTAGQTMNSRQSCQSSST